MNIQHFEILRISDSSYYNGRFNWTKADRHKTYNNLTMCENDARMLSKHFGGVIIVKVYELPNGKRKEYNMKVVNVN